MTANSPQAEWWPNEGTLQHQDVLIRGAAPGRPTPMTPVYAAIGTLRRIGTCSNPTVLVGEHGMSALVAGHPPFRFDRVVEHFDGSPPERIADHEAYRRPGKVERAVICFEGQDPSVLPGWVADDPVAEMRAEIAALRAQVAELKAMMGEGR